MNARQNPLTKLEAFIRGLVEGPFARLFPSRLEPIEIERKLERAMEDNSLLQGEGRRLSPNVYDLYMSIKDHQQMSTSQNMLIREWQNQLVEFARHRHYTLRTVPIIRLHADSSLHTGIIRIETEIADRQSQVRVGDGYTGAEPGTDGPITSTDCCRRAIQGRARQWTASSSHSRPSMAIMPEGRSASVPPTVQCTATNNVASGMAHYRLPQAGQQTYRIEKPIVNIGRQLSNDIIVEDKRVSRYHAQIKYQPDGQFAIFDLGSTNGITINNVPHLRHHILRNGDRFTIGSYDFYFERR